MQGLEVIIPREITAGSWRCKQVSSRARATGTPASFRTKPVSWHFVHVSVFFGSQAGRYRQFGIKMTLDLKKSVSPFVIFQATPIQVQLEDML